MFNISEINLLAEARSTAKNNILSERFIKTQVLPRLLKDKDIFVSRKGPYATEESPEWFDCVANQLRMMGLYVAFESGCWQYNEYGQRGDFYISRDQLPNGEWNILKTESRSKNLVISLIKRGVEIVRKIKEMVVVIENDNMRPRAMVIIKDKQLMRQYCSEKRKLNQIVIQLKKYDFRGQGYQKDNYSSFFKRVGITTKNNQYPSLYYDFMNGNSVCRLQHI